MTITKGSVLGDALRAQPKVSKSLMNKAKKEADRIKDIEEAQLSARLKKYKQ